MILDDKGRLFGKISIIDIFVLITVAAIIIVGVLKFGNTSHTAIRAREETIHIQFYMNALENFTVNAIKIGDIVSDDSNSNFLGNIVDIDVSESIEHDFSEAGILVASGIDNYSSILLTSEVRAQYLDGSVIINGNMYTTGSLIIIRAGNAKIQLHISDIIKM